jgi:hypothetical protein
MSEMTMAKKIRQGLIANNQIRGRFSPENIFFTLKVREKALTKGASSSWKNTKKSFEVQTFSFVTILSKNLSLRKKQKAF